MLKIFPLFPTRLKKLLDAWKDEIIAIKSRRQASISIRTNFLFYDFVASALNGVRICQAYAFSFANFAHPAYDDHS